MGDDAGIGAADLAVSFLGARKIETGALPVVFGPLNGRPDTDAAGSSPKSAKRAIGASGRGQYSAG